MILSIRSSISKASSHWLDQENMDERCADSRAETHDSGVRRNKARNAGFGSLLATIRGIGSKSGHETHRSIATQYPHVFFKRHDLIAIGINRYEGPVVDKLNL